MTKTISSLETFIEIKDALKTNIFLDCPNLQKYKIHKPNDKYKIYLSKDSKVFKKFFIKNLIHCEPDFDSNFQATFIPDIPGKFFVYSTVANNIIAEQ